MTNSSVNQLDPSLLQMQETLLAPKSSEAIKVQVAERPRVAAAGVHVLRRRLKACLKGESLTVANDVEGWQTVSEAFKKSDVQLVAIDVAGGFERGLIEALQSNGMSVVRLGTRQALDLARKRNTPRKIEKVDAQVLCDIADALVTFWPDSSIYML